VTGALTHHGGRLSDARARFGGTPADWLDLSTGINPRPWTPAVDIAIDWRGLPDPAALATLEQTTAAYFGSDPGLCLATPGSEIALRALARILQLPGRHLPLCYSTHREPFATMGAARDDRPSVLVLANPNNPDGAILSREAVLEALEQQERGGGWLIVDEAFADCTPPCSVANEVTESRRLIVTRSFGKFFGLAGVRLGFVLAPAALLEQVRQIQGEWPANAAALAFGTQAYADTSWIGAARAELTTAAARLDEVLLRHGLTPHGDCPLFRLVETDQAQALFEALAQRWILTRPFADHARLLRFGLPGAENALARLDAELARALAHG
jgi:cobalamin biosynthetic protein CobC